MKKQTNSPVLLTRVAFGSANSVAISLRCVAMFVRWKNTASNLALLTHIAFTATNSVETPFVEEHPYGWRELPLVSFLLRQKFCHDKHVFVTTKHIFCRNKSMFAVTKLLSRQNYVCCDKRRVLLWQNFSHDKNDASGSSRQPYTLRCLQVWVTTAIINERRCWDAEKMRLKQFMTGGRICLVGLAAALKATRVSA